MNTFQRRVKKLINIRLIILILITLFLVQFLYFSQDDLGRSESPKKGHGVGVRREVRQVVNKRFNPDSRYSKKGYRKRQPRIGNDRAGNIGYLYDETNKDIDYDDNTTYVDDSYTDKDYDKESDQDDWRAEVDRVGQKFGDPQLVRECWSLVRGKAPKGLMWDMSKAVRHRLNYTQVPTKDEQFEPNWEDQLGEDKMENKTDEVQFDCDSYLRDRFGGYYQTDWSSEKEKLFPLAFSILAYHNYDQLEQMLLAIYRPHNYYCLQIDKTAGSVFQSKVCSFD